MAWKMLVEEFQDGCLEIGNLLYANGMISVSAQENIWFDRRYCLKY